MKWINLMLILILFVLIMFQNSEIHELYEHVKNNYEKDLSTLKIILGFHVGNAPNP